MIEVIQYLSVIKFLKYYTTLDKSLVFYVPHFEIELLSTCNLDMQNFEEAHLISDVVHIIP